MKNAFIKLIKDLMDLYVESGDAKYLRAAERILEAYNEELGQ